MNRCKFCHIFLFIFAKSLKNHSDSYLNEINIKILDTRVEYIPILRTTILFLYVFQLIFFSFTHFWKINQPLDDGV